MPSGLGNHWPCERAVSGLLGRSKENVFERCLSRVAGQRRCSPRQSVRKNSDRPRSRIINAYTGLSTSASKCELMMMRSPPGRSTIDWLERFESPADRGP